LGLALASPAPAFGQHDCANAPDTVTLSQCVNEAAKTSDKQLNALYRQITKRLDDSSGTKKKLVQAQREWIKFRDAECTFRTAAVEGGSIMPVLYAQCVDALTRSRVSDFERFLRCEEGDLSCPVPPG